MLHLNRWTWIRCFNLSFPFRSRWSAELQRFPRACSRATRRCWRTEPTLSASIRPLSCSLSLDPRIALQPHAAQERLPAVSDCGLCHPAFPIKYLMVCCNLFKYSHFLSPAKTKNLGSLSFFLFVFIFYFLFVFILFFARLSPFVCLHYIL